ncbi:glycosyltransferase [Aneurinibacillus thermoaerophilus]|uniref:glycosyltransferase n=2 Tax=Aneurinibacillus thermoaerophilus TaxID=143495 RepID=UPI002E23DFB4|nr:glycosyltransferase [Aneurinibacillus thermoaerophilus]
MSSQNGDVINKRKKKLPNYILRAYAILKKHGLSHLIKKTINKLRIIMKLKLNNFDLPQLTNNTKLDISNPSKKRQVFIFAGIPYYDIGGGQRAAQLAKTFHKMGYSVSYIYAFESFESEKKQIPIMAAKHTHLKKYSIQQLISDLICDPLFIFEIPHKDFEPYLELGRKIGAKIVYEHIDNWDTKLGDLFYSIDILKKFLSNSDLIVATSQLLKDQLVRLIKESTDIKEKEVFYCPNAVDIELFDPLFITNEKPKDLVTGEKTLLYYGSLWGEWFDWELIEYVAKNCPHISINMIGDYQPIIDRVKKLPSNIHFLGLKPQQQLPAYLYYSDVAVLPFKNDHIGKYVSPLKIFEYIAMNKPVISTELPDVKGYPNVYCSDKKKEWVSFLNTDLTVENTNQFLLNNNWYSRVNFILDKFYVDNLEKKISVVVLNRNNKNVIFKCIDSLLEFQPRYNYEIIVVDNQSTDGSYELIKQKYASKIVIVQNSKNGCSSGRNLGVRQANGDLIVFLDSDQWVVSKRWLDAALEVLDFNRNIGAVSWAGGWFDKTSIVGVITDDLANRGIDKFSLFRKDIGYLGSGGMVIRREVFEMVEGFDENYDPTCYEDTDLSLKIRNLGYELAYCPYINIRHLPHQTTNSGSEEHIRLMDRNGFYFYEKWKKENSKLLSRYFW